MRFRVNSLTESELLARMFLLPRCTLIHPTSLILRIYSLQLLHLLKLDINVIFDSLVDESIQVSYYAQQIALDANFLITNSVDS